MPRIPQVTRTLKTTQVEVLCLDLKQEKPFNKTLVIPKVYKDNKHLLQKVKEIVDNENEKAVHIVSAEVKEMLYGMTEQRFLELATPLPPKSKQTTAN